MFSFVKVVLLGVAMLVLGGRTSAELTPPHPGLEYLHLGGFGPVSRLPSHPVFAQLGLTPHQAVGFVNVLLQNGFLSPHALRLPNGQQFVGELPHPGLVFDPYFFYLLTNYARFLPFGLGPQGIYGSTGLPKPRPVGVYKHPDKN